MEARVIVTALMDALVDVAWNSMFRSCRVSTERTRWSGDVVCGNNLLVLPVKPRRGMLLGVRHHPEPHAAPDNDNVLKFEGRACARNMVPDISIHEVGVPTTRRTARTSIWALH